MFRAIRFCFLLQGFVANSVSQNVLTVLYLAETV